MASIEVLCAADIHIGRRPGRLADKYDPADFSPRTTWANLAKSAIDRQVDAVVVAGDLVDRENRYAEAFGAVESVASTLSGADIPFFCVAGNHDHNVLPDLAEAIDDVQLLGRDGTWERAILAGTDGEPQVHVDGWSFPSRYHHESPLATYDLIDEGVPRLGVVHADMSDEDRYAPVVVDDLAASGHAAWVLGHLHNPGLRHETPPILYPGSLQPLDSSETGSHGTWLLSVGTDGTINTEPLESATLQYEKVVIETAPEHGFHDIIDTTHERLRDTVLECGLGTELLAVDVTIAGRTGAHSELRSRSTELEQIELTDGGTTVRVINVTIDTRPPIDLTDRAGDEDPVGYLAGLLRALDGDEPLDPYQDLVKAAHMSARETHESNAYRELRSHDDNYHRPTEAETRDVLRQQARKLVDAFLDQQGVSVDE